MCLWSVAYCDSEPATALELLEPAPVNAPVAKLGDNVIRMRLAQLGEGAHAIIDSSATAPLTVRLSLFEDTTFDVTFDRIERNAARTVATGTLDTVAGSAVTWVVRNGISVAAIHAPGIGEFRITHRSGSWCAVEQLDPKRALACGASIHRNQLDRAQFQSNQPRMIATGSQCDDGSVIDVMVVYTTDARVAAGGQTQIESLIDLAIADANAAFASSLINTSLNLVHSEEVSYVESGLSDTDGARLVNPNDGFLDGVHPLRDQFGADCVSLWVNTLDAGGIGFFPDASLTGIGASGMSVLRLDQAALLTFAHEIGHNLFCAHDRPNATGPPPFANYSYGFEEPGGAWRTIMAVSSGDLIPHFANPNVNWPGPVPPNPGPTGIAVGQTDPSDVALTINETRHIVANFRATAVGGLGPVLYVAADALAGGDGQSWATAINDLTDALCMASGANGAVSEIWVKAGAYKPGRGSDDRAASFHLVNGVSVYGGFDGSETQLAQRDVTANVTVLSGDIGTSGVAIDNSYHVVNASGTDGTAVLDGFTITAGNADGPHPHDGGGGVLIRGGGSARFVNCTITRNAATRLGGGMCNTNGSSPTLEQCMFSSNAVSDTVWPAGGGGMFNHSDSDPILTGCRFTANSARLGSGMANFFDCDPVITGCVFESNVGPANARGGAYYGDSNCLPVVVDTTFAFNSATFGGAMFHIFSGDAQLDRCLFVGNSAVNDGGGMYNHSSSVAQVTNTVFSGNTAAFGAAMISLFGSDTEITNCTFSANAASVGVGGIFGFESDPVLAHCILWQNSAGGFINEGAQISGTMTFPFIDYTTVEGWTGALGGSNNDGIDPLLVDVDGADNVIGTLDDNARLLPQSPVIDAGSNGLLPIGISLDFDRHPRIFGSVVDRGAFERVSGDFDHDGDIDEFDYAVLADCLAGPDASPAPQIPVTTQQCLDIFDADQDLDVDLLDAKQFSELFGSQP